VIKTSCRCDFAPVKTKTLVIKIGGVKGPHSRLPFYQQIEVDARGNRAGTELMNNLVTTRGRRELNFQ